VKIYIVEGGIGKHVIFTSLIPKLAEKEKIIVLSSYPDIYEGNPYVFRSLGRGNAFAWDDFIIKDEHEICFCEPYFNSDFIKNKISLREAWCKGHNIDFEETMLPQLYLSSYYRENAFNFKRQNGPFVVVQFSGGQSPLSVNLSQSYSPAGQLKNYPVNLAQEVVTLLQQKYSLKVLNYTIQNEGYNFDNTLTLNAPYLYYAALLEQAEFFITIDSSLIHYGGALKKKGITLWGSTSPVGLGYDFHVNLTNECQYKTPHCNKPYVRDLCDYIGNGERWKCNNPTCMLISPAAIDEQIEKLLRR